MATSVFSAPWFWMILFGILFVLIAGIVYAISRRSTTIVWILAILGILLVVAGVIWDIIESSRTVAERAVIAGQATTGQVTEVPVVVTPGGQTIYQPLEVSPPVAAQAVQLTTPQQLYQPRMQVPEVIIPQGNFRPQLLVPQQGTPLILTPSTTLPRIDINTPYLPQGGIVTVNY